MIDAHDTMELASLIRKDCIGGRGQRKLFIVNATQLRAYETSRAPAEIPLLSACGDDAELANLIHAYDHWGKPIHIGCHYTDELFEFWVEPDSE